MQNNVKQNIIALLVSVLVFILLTVILCLPLQKRLGIPVSPLNRASASTYVHDGVTYAGNFSFSVDAYTKSASRGQTVNITASSDIPTEVDITVYYSSGASTSSVFVPKRLDKNQNAVWEWKIPNNTTSDKIRIVLNNADTLAQLYIDII